MDQIRIIVQEADADIRYVLQVVLEDLKYQVETLANYNNLMATIESFMPHLVILDFKLTGSNCIEACIKIKLLHPSLPVIALSCNSTIDKIYSINGFDNYIKKPFDIDELHNIIQMHIGQNNKTATWSPTVLQALKARFYSDQVE